jgi:excisionase family DNA binding protein
MGGGSESSASPSEAALAEDFAPILLPEIAPTTKPRSPGTGGDRLLSVNEVARRLDVCSATVYKLCARGMLPHMRVLNAVRISPHDLEGFIASRCRSRS